MSDEIVRIAILTTLTLTACADFGEPTPTEAPLLVTLADGSQVEIQPSELCGPLEPLPYPVEVLPGERAGVMAIRALLPVPIDGEYTCTCSGNGGCTPVYYKGQFGCIHGDCGGSCTGSFGGGVARALAAGASVVERDGAQSIRFSRLRGLELSLATETEERCGNDAAAAAAVAESLPWLEGIFGEVAPDGIGVDVRVSYPGFVGIATLAVPALDRSARVLIVPEPVLGEKVSCRCNSSGSCTLDSSWGVKFCKNQNCTSCTMSVRDN